MISFGFAKVVRSIKDSLDGLTARFRSTSVPMNPALGEERVFYFEVDSSGKVKRNKLVEVIIGPQFVKRGPPKIAACRIYGQPVAIDRRLKMFKNEIKPKLLSTSEMAETLDKCNEYFAEQVKLLGLPQRRRSMSGFTPSSSSNVHHQVQTFASNDTSGTNGTTTTVATIIPSTTADSTNAPAPIVSSSTLTPIDESIERESVEPGHTSSTAATLDESASEYDTRGFLDGVAIYPGTKW